VPTWRRICNQEAGKTDNLAPKINLVHRAGWFLQPIGRCEFPGLGLACHSMKRMFSTRTVELRFVGLQKPIFVRLPNRKVAPAICPLPPQRHKVRASLGNSKSHLCCCAPIVWPGRRWNLSGNGLPILRCLWDGKHLKEQVVADLQFRAGD
jgi:hypothetical protein